MRLPDADGFIVAAQKALEGHEEVFLHNAEGAPVAVLLPISVYQAKVSWEELPEGDMPNHTHIEPEMGDEIPWNEWPTPPADALDDPYLWESGT